MSIAAHQNALCTLQLKGTPRTVIDSRTRHSQEREGVWNWSPLPLSRDPCLKWNRHVLWQMQGMHVITAADETASGAGAKGEALCLIGVGNG